MGARLLLCGLALLGCGVGPVSAAGPGSADAATPLQRAALQTPRAARSVMLGIARAGNRLVAVGERGIVLLSDDDGATWRQAPVPVSVTLAAVRFADDRRGWAVGHAGVVLHTQDGGERWASQLDGKAINALLAAPDPARTPEQQRRNDQFVQDGADKPLLDLYVKSARELFVVGAYGLALKSADGGATWQPWLDRIDNPKGLHLNAISGRADALFIVGEQGLVLRSTDGGERFTPVKMPYDGSFFAVQMPPDGSVVVAGLRGQAFRAAHAGGAFAKLALPMPVTVNAMALLPDGGVALGNQAGAIYAARAATADAAPTVEAVPTPAPVPLLSGLVQASDGRLVAAGAYGPARLASVRSR